VVPLQKLRLDQASQEAPENLLQMVREEGISQAACVNDLGTPKGAGLPVRGFPACEGVPCL